MSGRRLKFSRTAFRRRSSRLPRPRIQQRLDPARSCAAILQADANVGPNIILVPAGTYTLLAANGALPIATNDLNIIGQGAGATIQGPAALPTRYRRQRRLNIGLYNLTITGGNAGFGGGICSSKGNLSLNNTTVKNNVAAGNGGGI